MKRLLLDVDGVVADFFKATEIEMLRCYDLKPAHPWREWNISAMEWAYAPSFITEPQNIHESAARMYLSMVWNKRGFCSEIPVYPSAVTEVLELAEVFDVYFVTSPMVTSETWVYERSQWLVKYFGSELGKKVIHTHYKELVAGSALIDDKPQHVIDWTKENASRCDWRCDSAVHTFEGVLNRPYNQGIEGVRRYDSLLELLAYQ